MTLMSELNLRVQAYLFCGLDSAFPGWLGMIHEQGGQENRFHFCSLNWLIITINLSVVTRIGIRVHVSLD